MDSATKILSNTDPNEQRVRELVAEARAAAEPFIAERRVLMTRPTPSETESARLTELGWLDSVAALELPGSDVDEAWLEERRGSIGGSDAAAMLGISPYKSPYALYAEKALGIDTFSGNPEPARWGRILEAPVAREYSRRFGRKLAAGAHLTRHEEHSFLLANTDFSVVAQEGDDGNGVYEGKTTNQYLSNDWKAGPPLYYQVQVQHYLYVLGWTWGVATCLIGGQRLVAFRIERDDRFLRRYLRLAKAFWRRVEDKEAPPIDPSPSTERALDELFRRNRVEAEVVELDADGIELAHELRQVRTKIDQLESRRHEVQVSIKALMGNSEYALLDDGGAVGHYRNGTLRLLNQLPKKANAPEPRE